MVVKLKRVLLIDDSEPTNLFHKRTIEKLDCAEETVVKLDGLQGKEYLEELHATGATLPELILLDINMPRMDGWEFLDWFEGSDLRKEKSIVIIMVTTSPNPDDKRRVDDYGVVKDFIQKPLRESDLKRVISNYFN